MQELLIFLKNFPVGHKIQDPKINFSNVKKFLHTTCFSSHMHSSYWVTPKHTHHNPRSFSFFLYGEKKGRKIIVLIFAKYIYLPVNHWLQDPEADRKAESSVPKVREREKSERSWGRSNSSYTYLRCNIHIKKFLSMYKDLCGL